MANISEAMIVGGGATAPLKTPSPQSSSMDTLQAGIAPPAPTPEMTLGGLDPITELRVASAQSGIEKKVRTEQRSINKAQREAEKHLRDLWSDWEQKWDLGIETRENTQTGETEQRPIESWDNPERVPQMTNIATGLLDRSKEMSPEDP